MNIDDLKESISSMGEEELSKLLTEIRLSRRTQKASNRRASGLPNPKARPKAELSLEAILGSLEPKQVAEFLKKMGR
jgi:L-arabinose isomerase